MHVSGLDWIFSEIMADAAVTSTGGVCRWSGSRVDMEMLRDIIGCPLGLGAHSWPPSTESPNYLFPETGCLHDSLVVQPLCVL